MSSKDAHLYSMLGGKKRSRPEATTSGSIGFSSELSSLIASASTQRGRPSAGRSQKKKEDIFSTHNRNVHKRARKDLEPDDGRFEQKHSTSGDALDSVAWQRSKRKMAEKARLYAAMKRGDVDDEEGKHMVDFDTKWADKQDATWNNESSSGSGSEEEDEEEEEQMEWKDEYGRTRQGSRSQMLRYQRGLAVAAELHERARPTAPSQVIYGDTVQTQAFKPEVDIAEKMADLAAKRDRSLTPPPDTHFDASKEIRRKGVGFMQLSLDKEERDGELAALARDREETERKRGEREAKMQERREMLDRRRRELEEKRNKRQADAFLDELGREMGAKG